MKSKKISWQQKKRFFILFFFMIYSVTSLFYSSDNLSARENPFSLQSSDVISHELGQEPFLKGEPGKSPVYEGFAMLGGQMHAALRWGKKQSLLKQEQTIAGYRVVDITPKRVILEKNSKRLTINLIFEEQTN